MLLTIAIILGFGALEIGTGAITPGTLSYDILCNPVIYATD